MFSRVDRVDGRAAQKGAGFGDMPRLIVPPGSNRRMRLKELDMHRGMIGASWGGPAR